MVRNPRPGGALPALPEAVAVFLSTKAPEGCKLATIRLDRAGISATHREAGLEDPTATDGVRRTLRGIASRIGREQDQAKGLTAENLAAIRASACRPRELGGIGSRMETKAMAEARGILDIAICSVMRDSLLRRSEAAALRWRLVEFDNNGGGFVKLERSKTDQDGESVILYIGPQATADLLAIHPTTAAPNQSVFGVTAHSISRRIRAAALHAGLGDGYSGHSPRIGMAQDLEEHGAQMAGLMNAGRWKSPTMPAHYTRRRAAAKGAVARYYRRSAAPDV